MKCTINQSQIPTISIQENEQRLLHQFDFLRYTPKNSTTAEELLNQEADSRCITATENEIKLKD